MEPLDLEVQCEDGVKLKATLTEAKEPRAAVMIAPATGIKRGFYQALAAHLANSGISAITFDNRGIGDSLKGPIGDCPYDLQQWGELDMPAVLETLKLRYPNLHYHLIGHSAGGQLVGLMSNALDLSSMVTIASSSGSLKNMRGFFKLQAHFFMNVFIPLNNLLWGHTKSSWVGMGESLPAKVAAQWSEWCNGSGYVQMAFGKSITKHLYDDITMPSVWYYAADDPIAVFTNVAEMSKVYKNMPTQIVELDPKNSEIKEIGHMKFFSRKNKQFWPEVSDWIMKHNPK